jgi:hypothetical protein
MKYTNILSTITVLFVFNVHLSAQPESLETFFDFENITADGPEFIIGEAPFTIRVIGFKLQDVDPGLARSGSRALVVDPNVTDHKILFERAVNLLQFYAVDTLGGGRIELRERHFTAALSQQGTVNGLPTTPGLQSFVAFSGDINDLSDLNWTIGIKELKIVNPAGQLAIDDLGFSYFEGPPNNTIFEDFGFADQRAEFLFPTGSRTDFTIGFPPYTAHFTNGVITPGLPAYNHSIPGGGWHWGVVQAEISGQPVQEVTGVIEFETPVAQVEFYAAVFFLKDGLIEIFDTEGNLLTATDDVGLNISIELTEPFTYLSFNAAELGAPGGIGSVHYTNRTLTSSTGDISSIGLDDIGYTPIGAPGSGSEGPPPVQGPTITTQPTSQEVQSGTAILLSVAATGDDLTYQWYTGNSGDTATPVAGATGSSLTTGALTVSTNFWAQVNNAGGSTNSETAVITVAVPAVPLILDGTGDIAGENIQHANGNVFDQILLTGESIRLQARPNQITRVSFMDETEDIVQVEFSGAGSFTITLDPATFLPPAIPPRYNQAVEYVTGKPSVVIDGADANTFFSIFTVGRINAFNQALFPEGQVYDAQADVTLVEVVNSTGLGGVQLSNTAFSGSTGRVGVDARGVPIAVRLTVGDIDASGDAVPHLLFGSGSFTVAAGNPGLRITGGDLLQTNGAAVVVAESGSTTTGFDTLITQNNFKSDNTPQPTLSIDATFANEDGEEITVPVEELTIE